MVNNSLALSITHKILLGFILLSLSCLALANEESLPSRCNSSAIRKIEVPIYHNKNSPTFTYRFSVSEREDQDSPLLIFIPGGPGQTSMEAGLSYPYEYAIVRTDPRGMGCNKNSSIPQNSLSSEAIAQDIVSIVRELRPKRYFIHGISHGTMVATIAGKILQEENLPLPEAIILEGVVGKAFAPNEYINDVLSQWSRVKTKLPLSLQNSLQHQLPFGLSIPDWSAWLSSILAYGILPDGRDFAYEQLMLLDSQADPDDREILERTIKRTLSTPLTLEKINLFKEIVCREFVPDIREVRYDYSWSNGDLVATNDRLCAGIPFDRQFDSKNYQNTAPIYYISGGMDPVTPPSQALYHFENQKGPHVLISVAGGGHNSLGVNLFDCANAFWLGILKKDFHEIEIAMQSCQGHEGIKIRKK